MRAESWCHVASELHSDTQELRARSSPWLNVYGSVPTLSSGITSEPSWGIEGENPALYNARTPETGDNHLGGSFDSLDAKAEGGPSYRPRRIQTHCYGEGVLTCTILTNPRPNARAAPIPSPKFLPPLLQRHASARSRLKTVPAA